MLFHVEIVGAIMPIYVMKVLLEKVGVVFVASETLLRQLMSLKIKTLFLGSSKIYGLTV